ncbi:LAFA_0E05710g1_1 [Lachancea sp. 'fantastica']|nr:LAFA_0E05710g1_1 [Lachancea sp. 'fantastica']
MQNEFKKVSLSSSRDFSWAFLIDWILILCVCLLAAFYFGRAFGFTTTALLEWFVWRRYSVKVQIQSLKISFLGGRVFFKNLTIITENQTVSFLNGSLTWRYWIFSSRQTPLERQQNGASGSDSRLCRFKLECQGLEYFIYNRTQVFSHLWQSFSKTEQARFRQFEGFGEDQSSFHNTSSSSSFSNLDSSNAKSDTILEPAPQPLPSLPAFLKFLPLEIAVHKGALVVGNKNTSSILVVSYDKLAGIVDVGQPDSRLDLYKLQTSNNFDNFCIRLKPNLGFQVETPSIPSKHPVKPEKVSKLWHKGLDLLMSATSGRFKEIYQAKESAFQALQNPFEDWKGLSLYRKDDDSAWDDTFKFDVSKHQYARYSKIMKCEKFVVDYSFDVPGVTPRIESATAESPSKAEINDAKLLDQSPDFSVDMQLFGGVIHYGPWAHHEILPLQMMFSPVVSRDSQPPRAAKAGATRLYTKAKTSITVMSSSIWRLPTREPSKDLEFLKRYRETQDDSRSFGWLEILLAKGSEVTFDLAMTPNSSGFENFLDLHLVKPEVRTSVNHDILFSADMHDIHAEIGYPLGWNQLAFWNFNLTSTQAQLFILKDHVNLLADLLTDFGSGEPLSYDLFRPFVYKFSWKFEGYSIYLNVNDANIVNNPVDFNENCYLSFHGDDLQIDFSVPQTTIAGNSTTIDYSLFTSLFRLRINTPSWNTLHEFMKDQEVGRSHDFTINGSYLTYSKLDVDNIDTILINCHSRNTTLKCYGFVIRFLIGVKMNYFGDFVHFKTTEEYMEELKGAETGVTTASAAVDDFMKVIDPSGEKRADSSQVLPKEVSVQRKFSLKRLINEKDVWFTFIVESGCIILPAHLYDCENCFAFDFDHLSIDIRDLNYYMDLQTALSPVKITRLKDCDSDAAFNRVQHENADQVPDGVISELQIHAHRLYGLPPSEETYVCKWDFFIGDIEMSSDLCFPLQLGAAIKKFAFGFKDFENIMNYKLEDVLDLTSVTLVVRSINLRVKSISTRHVVVVRANELLATVVDLENDSYTCRANIEVPALSVTVLEEGSEERPVVRFESSLDVTNFAQLEDFLLHTRQQKAHIAANDAPFHRCPFLLPLVIQNSEVYNELLGCIPPGMSIPTLTEPLHAENCDQFLDRFLEGEDVEDIERPIKIRDWHKNGSRIDDSNYRQEVSSAEERRGNDAASNLKANSIIVNLKKAGLRLDPAGFVLVEDYMGILFSDSVDQIIDDSEIDTVMHFLKQNHAAGFMENVKIFCRDFKLILGEIDSKTRSSLQLEVSVKGMNVDGSTKRELQEDDKSVELDNHEGSSACIRFNFASIGILDTSGRLSTSNDEFLLYSSIKGFEAWYSSYDCGVISVNIQSSDSSINPTTVDKLWSYLQELFQDLSTLQAASSQYISSRKNAQKEFFYQIAKASEEYHIVHDPPVITKPAYITRLPDQHVREDRTWKIITRLRHILNYLPAALVSEIYGNIKGSDFKAPENAGELFLNVFSKWRSWEFSDLEKGLFYEHSFGSKEPTGIKIENAELRFDVSTFSLTLSKNVNEDGDAITLKDFRLSKPATQGITHDRKEAEKKFEIEGGAQHLTASVKLVKAFASESTMKLVLMKNSSSASQSPSTAHVREGKFLQLLQIVLLIDRCELQLVSGITKLNFKSFGNSLALALSEEAQGCSATTSWSWFELGVRYGDAILLDVFSRHGSVGALLSLNSDDTPCLVDAQLRSLRVKLPSPSTAYNEFIKSEGPLDALIGSRVNYWNNAAFPPHALQEPASSKIISQINIEDLSFDVCAISPFVISKRVQKLNLKVNMLSGRAVELTSEGFDLSLGMVADADQQIKFSQSKSELKLSETLSRSKKIYSISVDSEISKIKFCAPEKLVSILANGFDVAKKSSAELFENIKQMELFRDNAHAVKETPTVQLLPVQYAISLRAKYMGFLLPLNSTSYIFELNEVSSTVAARSDGFESSNIRNQYVQGRFSITSVAFLMNDIALPENLSKVLDFGVSVKVDQEPENVQSLEIESSHFRVALCPISLVKILALSKEFSGLGARLAQYNSTKSAEPDTSDEIFKMLSSIKSIHFLSYNLCLGWIFNDEEKTHPGLIWGYQRLFAAHEWPFGKLTILDAYFSVARGFAANNFYALESELDKPNRSFLPSTQLGYWFEGEEAAKDLFVRINGEQLDVSFLSKSVLVAEGMLKSLQAFEELKSLYLSSNTNFNETPKTFSTSKGLQFSGFSRLRSLNCRARYAGGVFKLYSEKDLSLGLHPSFQVESPSVEVVIDYKFNPSEERSHIVRSFVHVEKSHNAIFPSCVPILGEVIRDSNRVMKTFSTFPVSVQRPQMQESVDYKSLLKKFDISFQVHFDEQSITLSCEPKAKVQADVGFENLVISVFTNTLDHLRPVSFALDIKNVTATSRHIFSREISTSIKIDHSTVVFLLTHPDVITTYGVLLVPNIDVFFNFKQLQDLNVFINIWKVDSKVLSQPESDKNKTNIVAEKSLAAKHKKLASSSSLPWSFVTIISKVKGKIDLGVSLGILSLSTDSLWTITDHYKGWTQKLYLQLERVSLSSDGRLGGNVLLRDFNWNSRISWPIRGGIFQNPLITLGVTISEFAVKLSFDYHLILIASLEHFKIMLFNKRETGGLLKDFLSVSLSCGSTNIFATALAAANILDVYNTVLRMRRENRKSYFETLGDSNTRDTERPSTSREILDSLSFLRTDLEVRMDIINTQIFPNTLFDMEVLTFRAADLVTRSEIEGHEKLKSQLNCQVHNVKFALSTYKNQLNEKVASQIGVKEYIKHAAKAQGGTILVIPAILVGMTTWHDVATNVVELLYSNSFGGKISVRWNLGSINFIREMWATHVRALALRRSHDEQPKSLFEDEHLEDKLKDVDLGSKYTYVPIEEPHIEIPQTRDLGNATPPIEWFGVNRKHFPGMTHQGIIIPLQNLAHMAETEWTRIFGRA